MILRGFTPGDGLTLDLCLSSFLTQCLILFLSLWVNWPTNPAERKWRQMANICHQYQPAGMLLYLMRRLYTHAISRRKENQV